MVYSQHGRELMGCKSPVILRVQIFAAREEFRAVIVLVLVVVLEQEAAVGIRETRTTTTTSTMLEQEQELRPRQSSVLFS